MSILTDIDPRVRERCVPVTEFGDLLRAHVNDLFRELFSSKRRAIGLSSNQIGGRVRVFVIDENQGRGNPRGRLVIVNPSIHKTRGLKREWEGCLSIVGSEYLVTRHQIINWRGQDIDGRPIGGRAHGLLARCIQHEIDHLDGILISDKSDTSRA